MLAAGLVLCQHIVRDFFSAETDKPFLTPDSRRGHH